jgi:hypothetical protein
MDVNHAAFVPSVNWIAETGVFHWVVLNLIQRWIRIHKYLAGRKKNPRDW